MVNKFLALQKDVFDISKVEVVGSPTITSDGVVSGFSSSDYLKPPITSITTANSWKIKLKCTSWSGNISAQRVIVFEPSSDSNLVLAPSVNAFSFRIKGTTVNSDVKYTANTEYNVEFGWDGTAYYLIVNGVKNQVANTTFKPFEILSIGWMSNATDQFWKGSIDLTQLEVYVDNKLIYSPTKPTYLLERRKPKVWNKEQFTIVGNPSVSEDGFISNCSGSNYAKINNPITSVNNKFQVDCTIPIGTGVPFVIYIGTAARMYFWRNANNKLLVVLRSKSTDLLNTTVTVPETNLNVKCIVENNTCLVNVNGENLINKTITASAFFEMLNSADYFTFGSDIGNNPFNQPLDLKSFKIYIDNTLVFDGGKQKYLYDPSKFTVVGSPTITEYGVASGFTTANYIIQNGLLPTTGTHDYVFKLRYKHNTNTFSTTGYTFDLVLSPTNALYFSVASRVQTKTLSFIESTTGSAAIHDAAALVEGKVYDIEVQTDLATYYRGYINGVEYVNKSLSNAVNFKTGNLLIGIGPNQTMPLTMGELDLKYLSVIVDGKEVFTGAKEQFYMMFR